jgi:long-subunit acyl-CoA synthetase (AMP-forming)
MKSFCLAPFKNCPQAVGLYPTNSSAVNQFILRDCSANLMVVEDEKQAGQVLAMKNDLPDLKKIIQASAFPQLATYEILIVKEVGELCMYS